MGPFVVGLVPAHAGLCAGLSSSPFQDNGTCLQDVSNNTVTLAGGTVYAFIIPLTNFSAETMAEASLLDYNFVLLEEGIAGLAATCCCENLWRTRGSACAHCTAADFGGKTSKLTPRIVEAGARYHLCFAYVPPGGSDPSTQYGGSRCPWSHSMES